jgi:hypothetical protein
LYQLGSVETILLARAKMPKLLVGATIVTGPRDAWPHHLDRIVKNVSFATQNERMAAEFFSLVRFFVKRVVGS